jgi:hypothetical protein
MDLPIAESHSYLKVGDIIWIVLSERKYFLSGQRESDPFLECMRASRRRE